MELVKDIILQITFIILPVLIYHLLWFSRNHVDALKPNKVLITCGSMFSSILCIISPIEIIEGALFNLHIIPLFISFVYGGFISGLLTLLTTFVYFLHPNEFNWIYIVSSITMYGVLSYLIRFNWSTYTLKKKFIHAITFGVIVLFFSQLCILFVSALYSKYVTLNHYVIVAIATTILTLILALAIYLIEYMQASAVIRSELVKAEKLSIVSELAASVAHEVRNPLTVVRGFVQLIGTSESSDSQKREYMDLVLAELDRAQSIITDYLGMAGQSDMLKEKVNLTDTLNDITMLMTSYANYKTVTFKCHIDKHLYVFGDRAKLKQVFINIIKNSIEAVPNINGVVKINASVIADTILIKISDNGVGMTKEQITRLGEPYYSSKEDGTGLGLTVTYSILKTHGGSLKYKSELRKGTVAVISLPLYIDHQEPEYIHQIQQDLLG